MILGLKSLYKDLDDITGDGIYSMAYDSVEYDG